MLAVFYAPLAVASIETGVGGLAGFPYILSEIDDVYIFGRCLAILASPCFYVASGAVDAALHQD